MSYLEVRNVRKTYGAVQALSNAEMSVERGTIHGICGANGAGKSTLIRILAGATQPDAGEVVLRGETVREFTPQHLTSLGVGVVYQELALVPELPIYKNIFLGIEQGQWQFPRAESMRRSAREILAQMGVDLDINARVAELSLHQQQIVEIAKALCRGSSLLILDEPTAILNADEKRKLFAVLRELKQNGLCILFITHFIDELFEACDRLTVMRDGRTVDTFSIRETNPDAVVLAMIGTIAHHRALAANQQDRQPTVLSLHGATVESRFSDISLAVRQGEILGLAGLVGSGCYEVAEALFGMRQLDGGEIRLDGRPVHFRTPRAAIQAGIGYVPEDRRAKGLCLNLSSSTNVALPSLGNSRFSWWGIVKASATTREFLRMGERLRLRPLNPALSAASFSGGGQQKLVIGKWIEKECRVYIFVEPTRGVDVGAKAEIWRIIEQLGREGAAIVVVSTDFDDIAAICNQCLVFTYGRIVGELTRPHITPDAISSMAIGTASL